jgi:hypothetical protein
MRNPGGNEFSAHEQVIEALDQAAKSNVILGKYLLSSGLVNGENMVKALAGQFGL